MSGFFTPLFGCWHILSVLLLPLQRLLKSRQLISQRFHHPLHTPCFLGHPSILRRTSCPLSDSPESALRSVSLHHSIAQKINAEHSKPPSTLQYVLPLGRSFRQSFVAVYRIFASATATFSHRTRIHFLSFRTVGQCAVPVSGFSSSLAVGYALFLSFNSPYG